MRRPNPITVVLGVVSGLVFAFLIAPLVVIVPISFSSGQYLEFPPPGFSLRWYKRFFGDGQWLDSALQSLQIATLSTTLALVLGVPFALAATRSSGLLMRIATGAVLAPIIVPVMIYAIGAYFVFSAVGLLGSWVSIALANAALVLPFIVIIVTAGLQRFDLNTELAARGLGASHLRALWHVTLPQIAPSLLSGALLAFVMAFDELLVALFVSGPFPPLPLRMYENITIQIDPTVAAVSVFEIVLVLIVMLVILWRGGGIEAAATR